MKSLIFALGLLLFINQNCSACKCLNELTINDNWKYADHVFIGEVIKVDRIKQVYNGSGKQIPLFEIRILETFKRQVLKEFIFRTFVYANSCDFAFEQGKKYLIFANEYDGPPFLQSTQCSGTEPLEFVSENELKELKNLYKNFKFEKTNNLVRLEKENKEVEILWTANERLEAKGKLLIGLSSILGALLIVAVVKLWKKNNY